MSAKSVKYEVAIGSRAIKALKSVPAEDAKRILAAIYALVDAPFPAGFKKMKGEKDLFRIREGDYRIVYSVVRNQLLIKVVLVGHRRDVYKRL